MLISTQECPPVGENAPFAPLASAVTRIIKKARGTHDFILEAYHKDRRFTVLFVCSQ